MADQVDITKLTSTELKRLKAKQLDEQWKIKHPDGLYYIIGVASFNVRMPQAWNVGKLINRTTTISKPNLTSRKNNLISHF
jgi:hypothetical protein